MRVAEEYREWRRECGERERQRLEEARKRQELERLRAEEAGRVAALEHQASARRKAMDIRAYVAAARAAEPSARDERMRYSAWALRYAGQLDPTSPRASTPENGSSPE